MSNAPVKIVRTIDSQDKAQIINAIRKRIPEARAVVVTEFLDAVGVGLGANVNGEAILMTERMPKDPSRQDRLNMIDRFAEKIKEWRRFRRGAVLVDPNSKAGQQIFVGDLFGWLDSPTKKDTIQ